MRERHGYSREKLSGLADIDPKFLYEVETGKKGLSAQKMFALSRALGVTMDFLVSGELKNKNHEVIKFLIKDFDESLIKHLENIIHSIFMISKISSNLE